MLNDLLEKLVVTTRMRRAIVADGQGLALALFTKLGTREDVLHFDIPVDDGEA